MMDENGKEIGLGVSYVEEGNDGYDDDDDDEEFDDEFNFYLIL